MNNLQQEFDWVRENLFPGWDKDKKWKIELDADHPSAAVCYPESKLVKVKEIPQDTDRFRVWICHEISHDAGGLGHQDEWQVAMLRAAKRASDMGEECLAEKIEYHIGMLKARDEMSSRKRVLEQIRELTLNMGGNISFEEVIKNMAEGIMYPHEFISQYPESKSVYDEAMRTIANKPVS